MIGGSVGHHPDWRNNRHVDWTYSQIETIDRLVDLPLFQMEEGILLSTFLRDGVLSFQVNVLLDEHPLRMGLGGINL